MIGSRASSDVADALGALARSARSLATGAPVGRTLAELAEAAARGTGAEVAVLWLPEREGALSARAVWSVSAGLAAEVEGLRVESLDGAAALVRARIDDGADVLSVPFEAADGSGTLVLARRGAAFELGDTQLATRRGGAGRPRRAPRRRPGRRVRRGNAGRRRRRAGRRRRRRRRGRADRAARGRRSRRRRGARLAAPGRRARGGRRVRADRGRRRARARCARGGPRHGRAARRRRAERRRSSRSSWAGRCSARCRCASPPAALSTSACASS